MMCRMSSVLDRLDKFSEPSVDQSTSTLSAVQTVPSSPPAIVPSRSTEQSTMLSPSGKDKEQGDKVSYVFLSRACLSIACKVLLNCIILN